MGTGANQVLLGFVLLIAGIILLEAKWLGIGVLVTGGYFVAQGMSAFSAEKKRIAIEKQKQAELRRSGKVIDSDSLK